MVNSDPVLRYFRSELDRAYGDRLERVVLFGSRARGDAREDSDYDIAVFLKDMPDRWDEFDRLAFIESDITRSMHAVVRAMPFAAGSYRERTPLMHDIRNEGRDL